LPWSRVRIFIDALDFGRYCTYILAIFGLIVGLRIRLIGSSDEIAKLIDPEPLFLSGFVLATALIIWIFAETLFRLRAPSEVLIYFSIANFLEKEKASAATEQIWEESIGEKKNHWNEIDKEKNTISKYVVVAGLVLSLTLPALSLLFLFQSCFALLVHLLNSP